MAISGEFTSDYPAGSFVQCAVEEGMPEPPSPTASSIQTTTIRRVPALTVGTVAQVLGFRPPQRAVVPNSCGGWGISM